MTDTSRLFYEDAYRTEFEARVLERRQREAAQAVVLDRTCFYPESGGQPWDTGTLNGAAVVQVVEEGASILHVLGGESGANSDLAPGAEVIGRIDWPRRFDHMQQHTGQHILSQAFIEVLNGETRSFHLGAEASTLEIGLSRIEETDLERVERRANEIVFRDIEVKHYFVAAENIGQVPLRRPPKKEGTIRVVEVEGFDYSACGGTHCRRTGEVGLIKIIRWDKIRGNLRFEFLCGGRAREDYSRRNSALRRISALFSVSDADAPASVDKALTELKAQNKAARALREKLADHEAQNLVREAEGLVIRRVFPDKTPEEVRLLALAVIRQASRVVLFASSSGAQGHVILARSGDIPLDLRELTPLIAAEVNGKGGGSPSLVEIVASEPSGLERALEEGVQAVLSKVN
jgi:alanyl-tRNA synthetase